MSGVIYFTGLALAVYFVLRAGKCADREEVAGTIFWTTLYVVMLVSIWRQP